MKSLNPLNAYMRNPEPKPEAANPNPQSLSLMCQDYRVLVLLQALVEDKTCKTIEDALKTMPPKKQCCHYNPASLERGFRHIEGVEAFGMESTSGKVDDVP